MSSRAGLHDLARAAGIDPAYKSWRGTPAVASDDSLRAALRAIASDLGISPDAVDDPDAAIASLERLRWSELAPPVVIGWDGALEVPFSVRADFDAPWEIEATLESGRVVRASGRLFELPASEHANPGGIVSCVRRAPVFTGGELGYHRVSWRVAGAIGEALGICAPTKAWGGPGEGARRWGVFAPVYGLASSESGQAGDLGTLAQLFAQVGARGGSYVATLPLLAAFLDEPCAFSPYSPASRLFWNELYLDLRALSAEAGMVAPTPAPIVSGELIDYRAEYRSRRRALDPLAERLFATRGAEIDAWAHASGAYDYAAFRAFGESARTSWATWPAAWRDDVPLVDGRSSAIALGASGSSLTTHVVAQWAMQRQLEALRDTAGPRLYLDLPVGVSSDSYEVWRHRHLFLTSLSAGAPPDALFLGGQDWGLPPLSPHAQRRDGYRYLIRCLRHHMAVSGMLRIDHVMGLFRLYCVPHGRPATDGVYLRYPAHELLAILCLESSRARCALVGEDLGTVPDGVRPTMARHGLFRLHVGQWSLPAAVGEAPAPAPAESVASLNTHDTPTFAGWWRGADIDDRRSLDLITDAQVLGERAERDDARAALLAFAAHSIPAPAGPSSLTESELAMAAATADLAAGPAEVVLVALDDLVLDPIPHNVPGTTTQRPNWQRRITSWSSSLSPTSASPAATAALSSVIAARPSKP